VRVRPGGWVAVRMPSDTWPVTIRVGRSDPMPAFVDHIRGDDGSVETWAKVRCPQLRPGRYQVVAATADGVVETRITVV